MQRAILNLFLDRSIRLPLILERLNYSEILHSTKYALSTSFFPSFNETGRLQLGLLTARIFRSQTKNVRNKSAFLCTTPIPRNTFESLLGHITILTSPSYCDCRNHRLKITWTSLRNSWLNWIASTLLGLIWSQLTSTKFFVINCGPFLKNKAFFW